jgi:hypothetical protein
MSTAGPGAAASLLAALTLASGTSADVPHAAPSAPTLGVTYIVAVVNRTAGAVAVSYCELSPLTGYVTSDVTCADVPVAAGQSISWRKPVPWCTSQGDWENKHYIRVKVENPARVYYVWQSNENWVDRIRFFDQPWWKPQATPVAGASTVDGNRTLEVNADGSLYLRKP